MTRHYWICLLLISALTLMVATPLLAEYEYPDPKEDEEVDPDGLEGIKVGKDHQSEKDDFAKTGGNPAGSLSQLRNLLRTIRTIGF